MINQQVKLFTREDTPRLRYIAGIILGNILGFSWELITDKRRSGRHPVINYSNETIKGSFRIKPSSLLFESGISHQETEVGEWEGLPVICMEQDDADLPFDIFAASFYLISRYEEYVDHETDEFKRYRASSSLAYREGFLGIPVVDLWTERFKRTLLKKYRYLTFRRCEYRALLTIDIDQPFAYLGKSIIRSLGGMVKDIGTDTGRLKERYRTVAGGEKDPYEVFGYIDEQIYRYKPEVRFFFPVGDHSAYDKNPSWRNKEYRKLITKISDKYITGLHPSFYASDDDSMLNREVSRMTTLQGKEILLSRFHYIRLSFPRSYSNLTEAGIREDYSMGYPEEPGFRAGTSHPFCFYNIKEERETDLLVIPFQVMDATLHDYKNLNPEMAKKTIVSMMNEVKKVGGLFVSIWHNTSLLDNEERRGWRELFEFMLENQGS